MNIGFVLPGISLSGGLYVVFEHATRINCIENNKVYAITENRIPPNDYAWHPQAASLTWLTLDEAQAITFDIVIATFWFTVYLLPKLNAKHYIYFVQSIESRFYPDKSLYHTLWADASYLPRLRTITEASWIKKYLENKYGTQVFLAKNGIRKDLYHCDGSAIEPKCQGKLRVLVEGPLEIGFKNVIKTLELCKKSNADEVWLLTSTANADINLADRVFSKIAIEKVPDIYRSCDILIKLSYVEGMFGPPLEMFHCGGTAIVYDVSGHEEYIVNKYNALVIARDDEVGVVDAINHLKSDVDYLNKLKANALITAQSWPDWQSASQKFYAALLQINLMDGDNKNFLDEFSYHLRQWGAIGQELDAMKSQFDVAKSQLDVTKSQLDQVNNEFNRVQNEFLGLNNLITEILQSKSWVITKPLRYVGTLIKTLKNKIRD